MRRYTMALLLGLFAVALAHGHAIMITGSAEKLVVVFSDNLEPDARVKEATWKKIGTPTLSARGSDGKVIEVKTKSAESSLIATAPAGTALVYGTILYGVSTHGDKPKLSTYYPKAILDGSTGRAATLGESAVLEIVPQVDGDKVRFLVLAKGKPVAKVEVRVLLPDGKEAEATTTDEAGLTAAYEAKGRFGVTVRVTEAKSGEWKGEKYEEVGTVATLVATVK